MAKKGGKQFYPSNRMKSQAERREYNQFLRSSKVEARGTVENQNENLIGSNEMEKTSNYVYENVEKPVVDTPLAVKIKRYLVDKIIEIIIGVLIGVLVAVAIGAFTKYSNLNSQVAVIDNKIENIEKSIEGLKTNYSSIPDKYVTVISLEQSLQQLQTTIETGFQLNFKDIEHQLDLIEREIDALKE